MSVKDKYLVKKDTIVKKFYNNTNDILSININIEDEDVTYNITKYGTTLTVSKYFYEFEDKHINILNEVLNNILVNNERVIITSNEKLEDVFLKDETKLLSIKRNIKSKKLDLEINFVKIQDK